MGRGQIGDQILEHIVEIVPVAGPCGADDGHMEHDVTGNGKVRPGNFHQLAGVQSAFLLLPGLQRYDGVSDARELDHVVSAGEKAQTEGDGHTGTQIHRQQHRRQTQRPQDFQDGGVDLEIVVLSLIHGKHLRYPAGNGRCGRFLRHGYTGGGHGG